MKRVMSVIVTVALTAALGFVAWNSMNDDDQAAAPGRSSSPTTSPSDPGVTWRDPRGYTVTHPQGYQRSVFEGDVQIRPPGLPSVESGEGTFAITIQVEADTSHRGGCFGEMASPGTAGSILIEGERIATCDQVGDDGENWYRRTLTFMWDDHTCDHISLGCPSKDAGITLTVRIVSATKAMWDRYLGAAMTTVESIRRAPPQPNEDVTENIDRTT
jgi:hypothetical protein